MLTSLCMWCMVWILKILCILFRFQTMNWFTRMLMTSWRQWWNYTNKFVWRLIPWMTCTNGIPTCIGNYVSYKMVTWFRCIWGKNVFLTKGRTKVDAKSWRSLQAFVSGLWCESLQAFVFDSISKWWIGSQGCKWQFEGHDVTTPTSLCEDGSCEWHVQTEFQHAYETTCLTRWWLGLGAYEERIFS